LAASLPSRKPVIWNNTQVALADAQFDELSEPPESLTTTKSPRLFYSRRTFIDYLVILAFGLIVSAPHFGRLLVAGNDHLFHALRYLGTARALLDGQLVPLVDSSAMYGFGYSPNLFYPPLTAYLAMLTNLVSPNWNIAINLANIITIVLSGFTMYYFMRGVTGNNNSGLIAAVAFMSAPYLLINTTIRSAAGESLGLALAPLLFLGLWKILNGTPGWILLGLGAGGLLLTHNLSAVIFALFAVLFIVGFGSRFFNQFALLQAGKALLLCLGISAVFLLPFLEARSAAEYNAFQPGFMGGISLVNEHTHQSLAAALFPSFTIPYGWIGLLGIATVVLFPIVYRWIPVELRRLAIVLLVLSALAYLMTTFLFPWGQLPEAFWVIQFPWRLNIVTTLFLAALAGLVFPALITWVGELGRHWLPIAVALVFALLGLGTAGIVLDNSPESRHDVYALQDAWGFRLFNNDYLPVRAVNYGDNPGGGWFTVSELVRPHQPIALTGQMEFTEFTHFGRNLQFNAEVTQGGIVELPFIFYPGYQASVDGVRQPVFESDNGFVALELTNPGAHAITAHFGMTALTITGAIITLGTSAFLSAYGFTRIRAWRRHRSAESYD